MGTVPVHGGPELGSDVAKWYGLAGLLDVRDELPWYDGGGPTGRDNVQSKRSVVVHFTGVHEDFDRSDLDRIRGHALYHIQKNWGTGFPTVRGNGLMYHICITGSGQWLLTRTIEHWAWHAGWEEFNRKAVAVLVPIGPGQLMTGKQELGLRRFLDRWRSLRGGSAEDVYGHGELSSSYCPGSHLRAWLNGYRQGRGPSVSDVRYFAETGKVIGGAFLKHWQEHGGLMIFGLPLSNEFQIADAAGTEGRRTVQVFERAVLEWWPENVEPFKVLGRRLGSDVLDDVLAESVG